MIRRWAGWAGRWLGAPLLALTVSTGCTGQGQVWVVPATPPEPEIPVPAPLRGDTFPELVPTGTEGLMAAPDVDPQLYYVESEELWYRYWRRRWYQAFAWNGHWFPPEKVPDAVKARMQEGSRPRRAGKP